MRIIIMTLLVIIAIGACMYAMFITDSNVKFLKCVETCMISSHKATDKLKIKPAEVQDVIFSGCLKLCETK